MKRGKFVIESKQSIVATRMLNVLIFIDKDFVLDEKTKFRFLRNKNFKDKFFQKIRSEKRACQDPCS